MLLKDVIKILKASVITKVPDVNRPVDLAFASDLMSDVLTIDGNHILLVTGLSNTQAIRTAEMSDIGQIVIARNKEVTEEMIRLAEESNIVLMKSEYSVFRVSGLLYSAGIQPVY